MANRTSIIDIQGSDDAFQSYLASLQDYRKLLHENEVDFQEALAAVKASHDGNGKNSSRYQQSLRLTIGAEQFRQDTVTASISLAPQDAGHITSWQRSLNLQASSDLLLQRSVETAQTDPDTVQPQAIHTPVAPLSLLIPAQHPFPAEHQGHRLASGLPSGSRTETGSLSALPGQARTSIIPGNSVRPHTGHGHVADLTRNMSQDTRRHDEGNSTTTLSILPSAVKDMPQAGPDGLPDRITTMVETSSVRNISLQTLPETKGELPDSRLAETGITGQAVPTTGHSLWATGAHDLPSSPETVPDRRDENIPASSRLSGTATAHEHTHTTLPTGARNMFQTLSEQGTGSRLSNQQDTWATGWNRLERRLDRYHDDREQAFLAYDRRAERMNQDTRQWISSWQASLLKSMTDSIPQILGSIQNNTVIRIENHSGQDLSVAARQGAGI